MPIKKMPKSGGRTQPVAKKGPAAKKVGRSTKFNQAMADEICKQIAGGKSLNTICESKGMPNKATVLRWLSDKEKNEAFRDQYACACEERGNYYFEKMIAVAEDDSRDHSYDINQKTGEKTLLRNPVAVQRDKLKVDTYKWIAAKLNPKKYSDRVKVVGGDDGDKPITVNHYQDMSDEQLAKIAAEYAAAKQTEESAANDGDAE